MLSLAFQTHALASNYSSKGKSHIDFRTQHIIMMLAGGEVITNGVLKFRKVVEFESSCILICFSYVYLTIDGK